VHFKEKKYFALLKTPRFEQFSP